MNWMELTHLLSTFSLNLRTPFCTLTFTPKSFIAFLNVHTLEKNQYLSLMYVMYVGASNDTPSYTHISLYVVWRVHPPGLLHIHVHVPTSKIGVFAISHTKASISEKCPLKTRLPHNQLVAWCRGLPTWSNIVWGRLTDWLTAFPRQAVGWHLDSELIVLDSLWPVEFEHARVSGLPKKKKTCNNLFFSLSKDATYKVGLTCKGHGHTQGETVVSYRWIGWVLRNNRLKVQDFRRITDRFRGIYRIYIKWMKRNQKMSTCNRLDLESLGSWLTMPKNFPGNA